MAAASPALQATAYPTPDPGLADTAWQLDWWRPMEDAAPALHPAAGPQHTLRIGADGQAQWQIGCLRGDTTVVGRTTTRGDGPRLSGTLHFGELRVAADGCPPGQLAAQAGTPADDPLPRRLLAALPHVRGLLLEDGRLHLTLWADGGVLSFLPLPAPLGPSPAVTSTADEAPPTHQWQGRLRGRATVQRSIPAAAGQHLSIRLASPSSDLDFVLLPPGVPLGGEALYASALAGREAVLRLPASGRYTLVLGLGRQAARRPGAQAGYRVEARLAGAALTPRPAAHDARVPGTPFHATAEIACTPPYAAAGAPPARCAVGAIRYTKDGTATLVITGPNGLRRQLLFQQRQLVATDSAQAAQTTRQDDDTTVTIGGPGGERHTVPDALLTGG